MGRKFFRKPIEEVKSEALSSGLEYIHGFTSVDKKCWYKCVKPECGWVGESYPSNVRQGRGCRRCSGREPWTMDRLLQKLSEFNLEYISGFVNGNTPCLVRCKAESCGWAGDKRPSQLKHKGGGGCPRCCGKERVPVERVISDALKLNLEYISGYTFVHEKAYYRCLAEGCGWEGQKTPSDVQVGYGCIRCAGNEPYSDERLHSDADRIGLRYLGGYVSVNVGAKYACKVCDWSGDRTPASVRDGVGCVRCMGREKLTVDRLQSDAEKAGLKYIGGYVNADTPAKYKCLTCGSIDEKIPYNVKTGRGCRNCMVSGFNPKEPSDFYIYLINGDTVGYGISKCFEDRHYIHTRSFAEFSASYEIVYVGRFNSGYVAQGVERELKQKYKAVSNINGFKTESAKGDHLEEILNYVKFCVDNQETLAVKYTPSADEQN